jgi:hypothetical protein
MPKLIKGIPSKEYKQIHYLLNRQKYIDSDIKRGLIREKCDFCNCEFSLKSKNKHEKSAKHLKNVDIQFARLVDIFS